MVPTKNRRAKYASYLAFVSLAGVLISGLLGISSELVLGGGPATAASKTQTAKAQAAKAQSAKSQSAKTQVSSKPNPGTSLETTVSFAEAGLAVKEGASASVEVRLSRKLNFPVSGRIVPEGGNKLLRASVGDQTQDISGGNLSFAIAAGSQSARVPIFAPRDGSPEIDETASFNIVLNPVQGVSVVNRPFIAKVVDTDRRLLINVRAKGAVGDGQANDTAAIQAAMKEASANVPSVVLIPPGTYLVTTVDIGPGVTISGFGATILRPANQGKWIRTFNTGLTYSSEVDSAPLSIEGLTFDGNAKAQGPFRGHELEQAHLLFLSGATGKAGRLRVFVTDVSVNNGVADGVSVYNNVHATITNLNALDVFRGALVVTGGNSIVDATNVKTEATDVPTGIDIEVDGRGNGTFRSVITLTDVDMKGSFQAAVYEGSKVIVNRMNARGTGLNITNHNSAIEISNSRFVIGPADGYANRIIYPGDLRIKNTTFVVSRGSFSGGAPFFGLDVWWTYPGENLATGAQKLEIVDSQIVGDSTLLTDDKSIGINNQYRRSNDDRLVLTNTAIDGVSKQVNPAD